MKRFRSHPPQSNSQGYYLFIIKILSAISTLILIPTVLKICGKELWLQIATLQTIAIILSPLIQMHWTKFGGLTLSQNKENNQNAIVFNSVKSRLIVLTIINIIIICVLFKFFDHKYLGILIGSFLFASSTALSNEWYFLYKSNFRGYLMLESLPRFLFTTIPLFFIDSKTELSTLFFTLSIVNISTSLLILKKLEQKSTEVIVGNYDGLPKLKFTILQFFAFSILFSPVPIVNYFNFEDKFEFTLLEKFLRLFLTAVLPISQLAHSQILNAKNKKTISKDWYRKSKLASIGVLITYAPSAAIYLIITSSSGIIKSESLMFSLFGILIVAIFFNRVIEEIFVLNIKDMALVNFMQLSNIIMLIVSIAFAVILRSSEALLSSLILVEFARFVYMKKQVFLSRVLG